MQWVLDSIAWSALPQIVAIDILLGGDNAVIIAMACRNLPAHLRNSAIMAGVAGAIILRILLLFFAIQLLALPGLKLVGAALLLWIGIKLVIQDDESNDSITGGVNLLSAVKTIIVADAVMSLDNVLALAGAAGGSIVLVSLGVLISIPIIVWGSQLVLSLMDRFPKIVVLGAALLGWISGGMAASDTLLQSQTHLQTQLGHYSASAIGAIAVMALGLSMRKINKATKKQPPNFL